MLHWSLLGELYALFILLVLFVRYYIYERGTVRTRQQNQFLRCLTMSMGLIALNILCVYTLDNPDVVPRWLNILLNSLYFQVAICVSSQFAYMLFSTILEHVYDKHCLRRAMIVISAVLALSVIIVIANLFNGMLFYIDDAGIYHRGAWNKAYYGLLLIQVFFVGVCYFRNRRSVSERMIYVMRSVPPMVLILCVLQFMYQDVLLNGTICAMVSLVIFIAFRSHTAEQDSVTGAGSRKALIDELQLRSGSGQAVQMIQIAMTNLADINLLHGHAIGDALLYEVSHYLRGIGRQIRVFRSGGTVLTVMLPLKNDEDAERQLQQIISRMQEPWKLGEICCRLSFAVADLRSHDLTGTPSETMEQLDYTLAQAKKTPPVARYDAAVSQQIYRRIHLTELIRRAIDEKRFQVVYQPIYCCHKDEFCSAEALLRLTDDDGTPVPPDVFIPIAEENGMIVELTWIVLEEICRLLSRKEMAALQFVSMNLSTLQLMEPELPEKIRACLERYQLSPARLKVEITEQFILHNVQFARKQMAALEKLGLEIFMDDFGTGYSNLSSVLHFPFSVVKLDRSLVPGEDKAAIMVRALLKLFRNLDKRVIMEGVETAEQVAFLKEIDMDMIQGYYYAKPTTAEGLKAYFQK